MATPESDFVNILTHLYSRKASKKTFTAIRKVYKEQTGKDLCNVIRDAQTEAIKNIDKMPKGQLGTKVRTEAFKLIDYTTWIGYCPVPKGRKKKTGAVVRI